MLKKPSTCKGCPLYEKGTGYAPAVGPKDAKLAFIGEALGQEEAYAGKPFVGKSGKLLNRILYYIGLSREDIRIDNHIRCKPPNNWLHGAPWEKGALEHCSQYVNKTLDEGHPVVVGIGVLAKRLLGPGYENAKLENLHGAPARDPKDRFWIVSTFHPSFLLQKNWKFMGVVANDIQKAVDIANNGLNRVEPKLIADPGWSKFHAWTNFVLKKAEATPGGLWLAVDIETPGKHKKADEDDDDLIIGGSRLDTINRINFSIDPEVGYTVPFDSAHIEDIIRLLSSPHIKKAFWNMIFDKGHLESEGVPVAEPAYDLMWAWHMLQSNLKMGLGFAAPFFSDYGPWKHLTDHKTPIERLAGEQLDNYKKYSALDGVQTIRVVNGITKAMEKTGQWYWYERHMRDLDRFALRPAEEVGLPVNPDKLKILYAELWLEEQRLTKICQDAAPQEIVPHEKIWKTTRKIQDENGKLLPGIETFLEKELVYHCSLCDKTGVNKNHANTKKCNGAKLTLKEIYATRYFKRGKFNPNSPKQLIDYIKYQGHEPGKQKKSKADSADVSAIEKLQKKHPKDPVYSNILALREVGKNKSTYVGGALEKRDENNRVHTIFSHIPSTLRLSSKVFNLQNIVSSGKKESRSGEDLGERFRECVEPAPGCVLVEADFSGIEAVETGWFARDPDYIRLAKLSVHAYLTSHLIGEPADLSWTDEELEAYFAIMKKDHKIHYNKAKRAVHGCVPGDHEVLTEDGWIPIYKCSTEIRIAQWEEDGSIKFVYPSRITSGTYNDYLYKLKGTSIDIEMTDNHRVPYETNSKLKVKSAKELHEEVNYGRIPTSGIAGGLLQFDSYKKLEVAIAADGSLYNTTARFHLVKLRKIERLEILLKEANINYVKQECKCHSNGVRIRFKWPYDEMFSIIGLDKKFVLANLMLLTVKGKLEFLDEVLLWDGSGNAFFTTIKEEAIKVQTIAHLAGKQGLLRKNDNREGSFGYKPLYMVHINRRTRARIENLPVRTRINYNGEVYCPTVASGFFLVRHNDAISVTGNSSYGMSARALMLNYPEEFTTTKEAKKIQDILFDVAPKVRQWQLDTIKKADEQHYLGGDDHPYKYKHWFWDVVSREAVTKSDALRLRKLGWQVVQDRRGNYYKISNGSDAKRVLAFYPQSTAGGVIKESMLALFHPDSELYIGDLFYGKTPFRMPIHDALVLEVPKNKLDFALSRMVKAMRAPIKEQPLPESWNMGEYLTIGIEVEVGDNWGRMEHIDVDG